MAKKALLTTDDGIYHKVKKGFLTDDNAVYRKVKKAFLTVGGVYRPCWSGGEVTYYGAITALSKGRSELAAASVGDYALFGGGDDNYGSYKTVDAYTSNLSKVNVNSLNVDLAVGSALYGVCAASVGNYALFAGRVGSITHNSVTAYNENLTITSPTILSEGRYGVATTQNWVYALFGGGDGFHGYRTVVDAYNENLTRTTPTALSQARKNFAATCVGKYALFGGGFASTFYATVDAYDENLTRTTPTALSKARNYLAATSVGKYALFGGGIGQYRYNAVDAYDEDLTRTTPTSLANSRGALAATTLQNFALFGGGSDSTQTVDVYDERLTRTNPRGLSKGRDRLAATSVGNYALFAGGYATVYYDDEDGESYEEEVYYSTVDAYTVV